eukprot:SAG31_NODE_3463_length_4245_cov_2.612397_1_plen_215_part_00
MTSPHHHGACSDGFLPWIWPSASRVTRRNESRQLLEAYTRAVHNAHTLNGYTGTVRVDINLFCCVFPLLRPDTADESILSPSGGWWFGDNRDSRRAALSAAAVTTRRNHHSIPRLARIWEPSFVRTSPGDWCISRFCTMEWLERCFASDDTFVGWPSALLRKSLWGRLSCSMFARWSRKATGQRKRHRCRCAVGRHDCANAVPGGNMLSCVAQL